VPQRELARAEAARIAEADLVAPAVEHEPHALVRRVVGRVEQERAGHPQVHEQEDLILQLPHEVLAAPAERLHAASRHGLDDRGRVQRQAPARVVDTQVGQLPTLDDRGQPAADRLDFGQLGHRLRA
jgi:hypothetical protein